MKKIKNKKIENDNSKRIKQKKILNNTMNIKRRELYMKTEYAKEWQTKTKKSKGVKKNNTEQKYMCKEALKRKYKKKRKN